jgi:hypothetical protein
VRRGYNLNTYLISRSLNFLEASGADKACARIALLFTVLLAKHYSGDKIEKNEMGGSTYGEGKCSQGFGGET